MPSSLIELPTRYGRGLNLVDAPDALGDGEASVLENFRITGLGWLTTRKAAVELSQPDGDVVAVFPYNHTGSVGAVLIVWDATGQLLELWTVDGSGGSATNVGTIPGYATGISSRPVIVGAVLGRVLFLCDVVKTQGLVCYDPNDVLGSGSTMFQPTFDFDQTASFDEAYPRLVVEHLNHLWMFGYGDEGDPDRGEVGRFSFLGLQDDGQGVGDAGDGGASGSTNLFDLGDAVPIAARGEQIVSAASSNGRLVVCTEKRAVAIYGSGRDSWRKDSIDSSRGSVATPGMVEADGIVYWLSPLGPCRHRGGSVVEDLSRKIDPLMERIDFSSVFAAVNTQENQVRWYYRLRTDTTAGADRWFGWDYLNNVFLGDTLPFRVFCAGSLRPSGLEGPTAAPSSLTHVEIADFSARATWVNGDTSPGTRTRLWRALDDGMGSPETYVLMDVLPSGAGEYAHTGLKPVTAYWTRIEHLRNGQVTSSVEATFTTLTTGTLPAPVGLIAADDPILVGGQWQPSVMLSWDFADVEGGLKFHLERFDGLDWTEIHETDFGVSYYRDSDVEEDVGVVYRVSAEDPFGNTSPVSASAGVTPTVVDPYKEWPVE